MATAGNILIIDDAHLATVLHETANKLARGDSEWILDFSAVRQIDSSAVRALEKLAAIADERSVKLSLRGVNIDLYKTLKLIKLTDRFSFVD